MKKKYAAPRILALHEKDIFTHALTQYQILVTQDSCPGIECRDGINVHFDPAITNGQITLQVCFAEDPPEKGDPGFPIECNGDSSYQTTIVSIQPGGSITCDQNEDPDATPYTLVLSLSPNLTGDCVLTSLIGNKGNNDECDASNCPTT